MLVQVPIALHLNNNNKILNSTIYLAGFRLPQYPASMKMAMPKSLDTKIEGTIKRERRRLLDFIRRRIRITDDAEDILQDVFFQLIISYETIESIERVSAWLFQVARNKIIDRGRKKELDLVQDIQVGNVDENIKFVNLIDILPDPGSLTDQPLLRDTIRESLAAALEELPEDQREVFVMHELEDRSFKEISMVTGISVNTLLSKKRYAVLHLRHRLTDLFEALE